MIFFSFYCLLPLSTYPIFYYYCCSRLLDCSDFESAPSVVMDLSVMEVIANNSLNCLRGLEAGILHFLLVLNPFLYYLPWKALVVFMRDVSCWWNGFSAQKLTILREFYLFIFTAFSVCWSQGQGYFLVSSLENVETFFDPWLFSAHTIFHYDGLRCWL